MTLSVGSAWIWHRLGTLHEPIPLRTSAASRDRRVRLQMFQKYLKESDLEWRDYEPLVASPNMSFTETVLSFAKRGCAELLKLTNQMIR